MRKIIIILIVLTAFIFCSSSYAQTSRVWLNPGIKIGYQFGTDNGFLYGFELSMVTERGEIVQGILIDLDFCKSANTAKLTVGYEYRPFLNSHGPLGMSIGASAIFKNKNVKFGLTTIIYTGLLLLPFIGGTFGVDYSPLYEVGSYIKIPILLSGPDIKGFGG